MADRVYDAVVVGAGTMGSQAGLVLSQYGLSVLLIDTAEPPHTGGSHHGETRLYRQAYSGPGKGTQYIPLALQALDRWLTLERQSSRQLFHPSGVINIAPEEAPGHAAKAANAKLYGLDVEELGPKGMERRWPGLSVPRGLVGLWEPDAGILDLELSVRLTLAAAREAGAVFVQASVTKVEPRAVLTSRGTFRARRVLITANTGTPALLSGLVPSWRLPITAIRQTVVWFDSAPEHGTGRLPGFTFETGGAQFYGFPSFGSGLKVGRHDGGTLFAPTAAPAEFGAVPEDGRELAEFARKHLVGAGPPLRGIACRYDVSADEDFIIDQVEDASVWYAAGFSGHGFKFAPAIGSLLARWMVTDERPLLLEPFSSSRFH